MKKNYYVEEINNGGSASNNFSKMNNKFLTSRATINLLITNHVDVNKSNNNNNDKQW